MFRKFDEKIIEMVTPVRAMDDQSRPPPAPPPSPPSPPKEVTVD